MKISELLDGSNPLGMTGDMTVQLEGISADSREVQRGFLFIAMKGAKTDGHNFIESAIEKGAVAILFDDENWKPKIAALSGITGVFVPDSRRVMGGLSARFYNEPSKRLKLVGITGTNGKTTTSYILESIFKSAGFSPGVLGTVNYRYAGRTLNSGKTTPDAVELQSVLSDMVDCGVTHCVMEVSSHALDQGRVDGCHFDTVVFTNLTQDHLDYHESMEAYGRAKELLFMEMAHAEKAAVINIDDSFGKKLAAKVKKVTGYGMRKGDIFPSSIEKKSDGFDVVFETVAGEIKIKTALVGEHNLYNIMAAMGAAISLGLEKESIEAGITSLIRIPGRLEQVLLPEHCRNMRAFVDYAHTPDALERVIKALKPTTAGRLMTLFGCGGDRDVEKRVMMGEVSARFSDLTIITSDNPRSEDPLSIIKEIEKGVLAGGAVKGKSYLVIADRREAIIEAARNLEEGDTLLIAGKGHEDYQIVGEKVLSFNDRIEAEKAFGLISEESRVA